MAIYTSLFISCDHCKATLWKVLPVGPGLLLGDIFFRALNLPTADDWFAFTGGFLISALIVAGLAKALASPAKAVRPLLFLVLTASSFLAFCTLSVIRA